MLYMYTLCSECHYCNHACIYIVCNPGYIEVMKGLQIVYVPWLVIYTCIAVLTYIIYTSVHYLSLGIAVLEVKSTL